MGSTTLDVHLDDYACMQIHGKPVQQMAKRVGGKSDTMLSKEDVVAFLRDNVSKRAAGYTDEAHDNLIRELKQNAGRCINIPALWNPNIFETIFSKSGASKPKIIDGTGQLKPEDVTNGAPARGVVLEPKRVLNFGGDINVPDEPAIAFDNTFPGGRMGHVLQVGTSAFTVVTTPENAPPINESPWYAFRITNPTEKPRTITLNLAYEGTVHRYPPKISYDGHHWETLSPLPGDVSRGHTASYSLMVDKRPIWVSSQELMTSDRIEDWAKGMVASHPYITLRSAGVSHGGRSLPVLEINKGKTAKPTVVIIGRQHPPEVTGTLAQMRFAESLCDGSALSEKFLKKFNVIVMPNMNPDGVDQGHWRHNGIGPCADTDNDGKCDSGKGGVDLNRDWLAFKEPETQAARAVIESVAKNGIPFFMDFHSTAKDVMYLVQKGKDEHGKSIFDPQVKDWIDRLSKREKDYQFTLIPLLNDSPITLKTSEGWADKKLGVPAVTYEVGHESPRDSTNSIARSAAYAMIEHLLQK